MKLSQVFGVVIAVHVLAIVLLFASPGCSASRRTPVRSTPEATVVGTQPDTLSPMAVSSGGPLDTADLNPGAAPFSPLTTDPAAVSFTMPPATNSDTPRYSPTRPGASGATTTSPSEIPAAETYTVVAGDSLWKIAKAHGVTVPELRSANNLPTTPTLRVGQKLVIPGKAGTGAGAPVAGGALPATEPVSYTVVGGDTLGGIARRHRTTAGAIRALNNLRGDTVRVGQTLKIPVEGTFANAAVAAGGTAGTEPTLTPAPAPSSSTPSATPARASGESFTHTVAPGETLGAIARRYSMKIADIATINAITDPTKLRAGQKLTIPGSRPAGGTTSTAATTSPAPDTSTPAEPAPFPPATIPDLDAGLPMTPDAAVPTLPTQVEPTDIPVITPSSEPPPPGGR